MRSSRCAFLVVLLFLRAPASAAFVTVYSVPTYTPGVGGYQGGISSFDGVNGAGWAAKYDSAGANKGGRPIRVSLDASSALLQVTELGIFGTDASGVTFGVAALDGAGNIFGTVDRYDDAGVNKGRRAVRWDASGAPTELENLSTTPSGIASSWIAAVNDAGAYVGAAKKFDALGVDLGTRAVRWDASGAITELGTLGANSGGWEDSQAIAISDAGVVIGNSAKYDAAGDYKGYRAVRFDASGTAATELANLGVDPDGHTFTQAGASNSAGAVVGSAWKYDASGVVLGEVPVRWDASGAITELESLGPAYIAFDRQFASDVNESGVAIGWYASGQYGRAVRWDASGAATELKKPSDVTGSVSPSAINNAGLTVGVFDAYNLAYNDPYAARALYWGQDAVGVDLNTLIDPDSGWTLTLAYSISDANWISGVGQFDPDGPGGQAAYSRMYVMQLPLTVPEPNGIVLLTLSVSAIFQSRLSRPHSHASIGSAPHLTRPRLGK